MSGFTLCHCCRSRPGAVVQSSMLHVRTRLCKDCADAMHAPSPCLLCDTRQLFWTCARLNHLGETHPRIVEKLTNEPELRPPDVPQPQIVGRILYDLRTGEIVGAHRVVETTRKG